MLYQIHPYPLINKGNLNQSINMPRKLIYNSNIKKLVKLEKQLLTHPSFIYQSKKKIFKVIQLTLKRHINETEKHSIFIEGAYPREEVLKELKHLFDKKIHTFQKRPATAHDLLDFATAHLQLHALDIVREFNGDVGVILRGNKGVYTGMPRAWTLTNLLFKGLSYPMLTQSREDMLALAFMKFIYIQHFHPFIDGNGRAGRSLLNSELIYLGLPPLTITQKNRDSYIEYIEESAIAFNHIRPLWRELSEYLNYLDEDWRDSIVIKLVLEMSAKETISFINWGIENIIETGEFMLNCFPNK